MTNASTIVSEEKRDFIYKARMFYEKMNGKMNEKVEGLQSSYKENFIAASATQISTLLCWIVANNLNKSSQSPTINYKITTLLNQEFQKTLDNVFSLWYNQPVLN